MAIAKTFTVTVAGGKFVIDGVSQDTVMIGAGLTYKFDQSDNTNDGHPLRFATQADAASSSQYTNGVTTSGTPGNSGAYTQIAVQDGAPTTLYYYCTNHSGMGGEANTDGWGRSMWGQADWGDTNLVVQGWGRLGWGSQAYGDAPVVALSGLSATSAVGAPTVEVRPGWGTLDWGENGWGSVEEGIENLIGIGATSSVGSLTLAIGVPLTGVSATASCPTQLDIPQLITGVSATVSEGQLNLNDGSDHVQGLATLVATSAVGSILPADVVGISGVEATASVGPNVEVDDTVVVDLTGLCAGATSSVGAIVPDGMALGISGVSCTSSVGSITPADVVGLTGVSATVTVGNVAPLGYQDIDITGNTSYNDVDVSGNTSYTDVTHAA